MLKFSTDSPYRTPISYAILTLGEKGRLQILKKKWWQEIGGGLCKKDDTEKSANTSELGLSNVGGVFLVLMCGCAASVIIAICEFLWNIRKVAVKEKVRLSSACFCQYLHHHCPNVKNVSFMFAFGQITPREALVAELKFAVNIWAVTKPIKIAKTNSSASSVEGGLGRGSTARSIVGSFLRLDMLNKFDRDRDTNNRSNDRKIN